MLKSQCSSGCRASPDENGDEDEVEDEDENEDEGNGDSDGDGGVEDWRVRSKG